MDVNVNCKLQYSCATLPNLLEFIIEPKKSQTDARKVKLMRLRKVAPKMYQIKLNKN